MYSFILLITSMGWITGIIAAIYCFWDASERRMKNPLLWAICGGLFNLLTIALLHGNRWLKQGETRSGGRGWDSCRWFAILATPFFFLLGITGISTISNQITSTSDSASQAGTAIGGAIGLGMIFFLWLAVSVSSLLIGFMLRKDVKESGPTGPLATKI